MDNMPILYRNILSGLPSDFARDIFLWATDKTKDDPQLYKAEKFAREACELVLTMQELIDIAEFSKFKSGGHILDNDQKLDLLDFMKKRHANYRLGGNLKTIY